MRLTSPTTATVIVGKVSVTATIEHGVDAADRSEHDRPRVCRILEIKRIDGQAFEAPLTVDMQRLAADVAIAAASSMQSDDPHAWRYVADVVRFAAGFFGSGWTPTSEEWLLKTWRHLVEHGCDTAQDLADALGVDAVSIRAKISELRSSLGVDLVPLGRSGRRKSADH